MTSATEAAGAVCCPGHEIVASYVDLQDIGRQQASQSLRSSFQAQNCPPPTMGEQDSGLNGHNSTILANDRQLESQKPKLTTKDRIGHFTWSASRYQANKSLLTDLGIGSPAQCPPARQLLSLAKHRTASPASPPSARSSSSSISSS